MLHYHNVFLKQSLQPGYPTDSIDKMLVGNIAYQLRLGKDRETESEEMDKLLFVNRPFVFACHKVCFWRSSPPTPRKSHMSPIFD